MKMSPWLIRFPAKTLCRSRKPVIHAPLRRKAFQVSGVKRSNKCFMRSPSTCWSSTLAAVSAAWIQHKRLLSGTSVFKNQYRLSPELKLLPAVPIRSAFLRLLHLPSLYQSQKTRLPGLYWGRTPVRLRNFPDQHGSPKSRGVTVKKTMR